MFLINSRLGLFHCALQMLGASDHNPKEDPFSRSYGANLPSSLTRFLSRALVYSTFLPVSVYGTVTYDQRLEAFLGSMSISQSASSEDSTSHHVSGLFLADLPIRTPYALRPPLPIDRQPSLLRHSITHTGGTGILTCFPSTYAFRPRLRGRLTLGGRTFPRKP
jgi:hypothetical protein